MKRWLQYLVILGGLAAAASLAWQYLIPAAKPYEPSPAELRADLAEGQSREIRAAAAAKLGALRDVESMPALLDALEDPETVVRGRAGVAIVNILRADFLFRAEDPIEKRRAAIKRIRNHWEAWQKKGLPGA